MILLDIKRIFHYQQVYIELVFDDIFQNFHLLRLLHQRYHLLLLVPVEEYNVQQFEYHLDRQLIDMSKFMILFRIFTYVDRRYRQMSK
jgi:hypothetical protein